MINAIVVDDEKPSREALHTYLNDFCPTVNVVSVCNSVKSAFDSIQKHKPQLVFLDIEMPNGSGFDLLQMSKPLTYKVIFVTAFSEYAIRAFRYCATDYLLKPVKVDELIDAVNKVEYELNYGFGNHNIETLLTSVESHDSDFKKLVIPDLKGFNVIDLDHIIMCEADGYCTHIYTDSKSKLTSSKNLRYYEELLGEMHFLRVHNSFLLNINHVTGYLNQGIISLSHNYTCPLGNTYKAAFLRKFKKYK